MVSQELLGSSAAMPSNAISLIQIDLFSDAGKRGLVLNPLQLGVEVK
jgi:hypothetical protein